uniref:Uncharacterized protein n=2 Tax=unclassified Caudoviricetes TaxID=2788787 RepID=A0A8S5Q716_9CAUD|nr:MAG TPA: hypothetical protein [Siphoviridae sp. ctAvK3]DAE15158.1 MAG TPA: hypothetical protein [Siphoviridae sp. ctdVv30]
MLILSLYNEATHSTPIPPPFQPHAHAHPLPPLHAAVSYIIFDITIKFHKTVINQRFYAIFIFLCSYINLEIANV